MTKRLLDVDGVGLMLVDAEGMLRWAAASASRPNSWNRPRKHWRRACTDAFWQRAPVPVRDVTREGAEIASALLSASWAA